MPYGWALCALLVLGLLFGLGETTAHASAGATYGEVARFGGFDGSGSVEGKFGEPVGFAVDAENPLEETADGNAVWVLDRVVDVPGEGHLGYRLQKLSSSGVVLGSVTLPVESFLDTQNLTDANPLISLAVDSQEHRVYALVQSIVFTGRGNYVPVAQRLVAWSTTPVAKALLAAPGFPVDSLTGAGLIAGASVLQANLSVVEDEEEEVRGIDGALAVPEGLSVDKSSHDVVIEAQDGMRRGLGGPTMLQRVATTGPGKGQLDGSWVADEQTTPNGEQGGGLFTTSTGNYGVDLFQGDGRISRLEEVNPDLSTLTPLAPDTSASVNKDQAPTLDGRFTSNYNSTESGDLNSINTLSVYTAAGPITQLTNGLYAAKYAHSSGGGAVTSDIQSNLAPWSTGPEEYLSAFWVEGTGGASPVGNVGVRLFEADGQILTTLGGQPEGQACNLDQPQLSVAAGANGSLFVLTQPNAGNGDSDDQVIEFAPGASGACPVPGGQVAVNGTPDATIAVVHQGVPVTLEAGSIDRAGEAPFEFDWNPTGANTGGPQNDGFTLVSAMSGPEYKWPSPTAEYTYETPGLYAASVRLTGDYGTSVFPFEVRVLGSAPPVAVLEPPASITAGQSVSFGGSASTPTPGSAIQDYHWEYGDGSAADDTQVAHDSHTFASPGSYKVKLTITDEVSNEATAEAQVTVSPGSTTTTTTTTTTSAHPPTATTTSTTTTVTPPPPPAPGVAVAHVTSNVSGGAVPIVVSCPAGSSSCTGSVQLHTAGAVAAAVLAKRDKRKTKKQALLLGRASFNVPGGHSETLLVHLSSKGMAVLNRAHSLRVAVVIATTVGGHTQTTTKNLVLRAPAKKTKKAAHRHR